jgi:hypothetical protein
MAFLIESSQAWRGIVCEHCRYPMNRVPPHTGLSPRQRAESTTTCLIASEPASLLGRASALPRVPRLRTMPFCSGRTMVLPCAPQLRTSPPYSGGLRHCNVPRSSRPRLPAQGGSDDVTCSTAPDLAFQLGRAPVLPCAPWLSTGCELKE